MAAPVPQWRPLAMGPLAMAAPSYGGPLAMVAPSFGGHEPSISDAGFRILS